MQDRQRLLSERQKLAELLEQSDQLLHFSKSQQAQAERQQQDLLRMTERLVKAQEQRKLEYVEAQVSVEVSELTLSHKALAPPDLSCRGRSSAKPSNSKWWLA